MDTHKVVAQCTLHQEVLVGAELVQAMGIHHRVVTVVT